MTFKNAKKLSKYNPPFLLKFLPEKKPNPYFENKFLPTIITHTIKPKQLELMKIIFLKPIV